MFNILSLLDTAVHCNKTVIIFQHVKHTTLWTYMFKFCIHKMVLVGVYKLGWTD